MPEGQGDDGCIKLIAISIPVFGWPEARHRLAQVDPCLVRPEHPAPDPGSGPEST